MEKLEHPLWIVELVNALLGPLVVKGGEAMGFHFANPAEPIPPYIVMVLLIVSGLTVLSLIVRSRLSVENPGKLQILLEDALRAVVGLLDEWIGPKGHRYLPLVGTLGVFILLGNYMGLVPGLMAPTSSINVTLGCALTIWVYYHYQGIRENGIVTGIQRVRLTDLATHLGAASGTARLGSVWLPTVSLALLGGRSLRGELEQQARPVGERGRPQGAPLGEHGPAVLSRGPGGVTSGCVLRLAGWHHHQTGSSRPVLKDRGRGGQKRGGSPELLRLAVGDAGTESSRSVGGGPGGRTVGPWRPWSRGPDSARIH